VKAGMHEFMVRLRWMSSARRFHDTQKQATFFV
jgi:hypothetical protein